MKKTKHKKFIMLVLLQIGLSTLSLIIHRTLMSFINSLFITGSIFFIIGYIILIKEKEIFKLTSYGFKKINLHYKETNYSTKNQEEHLNFNQFFFKKNETKKIAMPILLSGIAILIMSFIISYLL
ncbi:MAG: DUF3899 domain-containing protein [Eubacteriales bacterium]